MTVILIANICIASVFISSVLYQARGREESMLMWGCIFGVLSCGIVFMPNIHLAILLFLGMHILVVSSMGPWKRKNVFVMNWAGRDARKVKEDVVNLRGVADNEDLHIIDASHILEDPLYIKMYTSVNQQEEVWKDLQKLKSKNIRYEFKSGPISSLFVDSKDADLACAVLDIQVAVIGDPSVN